MSNSESEGLHEVEVIVKEEVLMIKSSGIDDVLAEPQNGWLDDALGTTGTARHGPAARSRSVSSR